MSRLQTLYDLRTDNSPTSSFESALSHYLYALSSFETSAPDVDSEAMRELQAGLEGLRNRLSATPSPSEADVSRDVLKQLLSRYASQVVVAFERKDSEVRETLKALGTAAETLSAYGEQEHTHLKEVTRQLQDASQAETLTEIRQALRRQISDLRRTTDAVSKRNSDSVAQLKDQLRHFQQRLERAEALASTDELTGLLNRREGEARLAEWIRRASPFCLLVFDLDRFKSINDRVGHNAGDYVLRSFSKQLANAVSSSDVVCRWGGDEFIALMSCSLAAAVQRAQELRSILTTQVTTVLLEKEYRLVVSATIGVAEFVTGESAETLFARADQALYGLKNRSRRLSD